MGKDYSGEGRKIAMKRYIPVFSAAAVIVMAALFFILRADPDISGEYETWINGKATAAVLTVKEEGNSFSLEMTGERGLSAAYRVERNFLNSYMFEIEAGPHIVARYEIKKTRLGLEGTADILPIGKVEIRFVKKPKKGNE